jgi:6-carboxyhexanoate--CoA ligase
MTKHLWSIRMRASKTASAREGRNGERELHISGAEGIYPASEIPFVVTRYTERALTHPKGTTDKIVLTAELIREKPHMILALPVSTVSCRAPDEGKTIVQEILSVLGITKKALHTGFGVIQKGGMRGAAIISAGRGFRLDPDKQRGVRVSRLGITAPASRMLSARLSDCGINTDIVREAVILASKVVSHKGVIAELCVSDDPDYTTGYVASDTFGYIRIPHIKVNKSTVGGRVFFVHEGLDITGLISYLETTPVMVGRVSPCAGTHSVYEVLNSSHR